jgi:hypothetical protein
MDASAGSSHSQGGREEVHHESSKCFLLNYDPNSLKVAKLVSEAEACYREAWAGATLGMAGGVGAEPPRYGLGFCYIILL